MQTCKECKFFEIERNIGSCNITLHHIDSSSTACQDFEQRTRTVAWWNPETSEVKGVKILPGNPLDVQIAGDHYKGCAIQPAEFNQRNKVPFLEGCVIKRMIRHKDKNGKEDLIKAKHEIDLIIEFDYPETEEM